MRFFVIFALIRETHKTVSEETTTTEDGQARSTSPTPQAGQTPAETTPQAGNAALSADALAKELEDARREAAKHRTEKNSVKSELDKLKAELDKLQAAQLTEEERKTKEYQKAQERAAALEAQLAETLKRNQELQLKTAVQAAAVKLGVIDPDAAYLLLDKTALAPTDNGETDPAKVETAVKALLTAKPYLRGGGPQTSAANPAKSTQERSEGDNDRRQRLYGGGVNVFDASQAKQRGGGVIWPKADGTG